MAERFLLGVDGGNTKTLALVAHADGTIAGGGRAGCSDIFNAPSENEALAELDAAVNEALAGAGISVDGIDCAVFGLAGADWPEDIAYLEAHVRTRGYGERFTVVNDAIPALRAGTTDGIGVVVSCGTGLAAAARNAAGQSWHSGFWAEPLGGGRMGRDALNEVVRAELGIEPATTLRAAVLGHFGKTDVEALLRDIFGHDRPPLTDRAFARLAPAVLDSARAGDTAAGRIVEEHGQKLADYALAAARQVGMRAPDTPLVLNGGLFRDPGGVLVSALRRHLPEGGFASVTLGREPVLGALLMAFDDCDQAVTRDVMDRLVASMPSGAIGSAVN